MGVDVGVEMRVAVGVGVAVGVEMRVAVGGTGVSVGACAVSLAAMALDSAALVAARSGVGAGCSISHPTPSNSRTSTRAINKANEIR
jgi:hypothetical protein